MSRIVSTVLLGTLVLGIAGCASRSDTATEPPAAAVPVPADSPLAKVKPGMGMAEVVQALGEPTDKNRYMSGKAWIPFYYGNDASREEWHYKGMGSVTFAAGNVFGGAGGEVVQVNYNPSDSGYRK